MRIILATAHPYLPQIAGGAQSNMHEMAIALRGRGHQVSIVAGLTGEGSLGLKARISLKLGRSFHTDSRLGYPVFRTWFPWEVAHAIVRRVSPDVAIAQSGLPAKMAHSFKQQGVPTIIHFHNVEDDDLSGMSASLADAFVANSKFTAERTEALFGVKSKVIVPSFIRDNYTAPRQGDYVTFINPHPKKGVELMIQVVQRLPDLKFLFVKAWTLSLAEEERLAEWARVFPNLTVRERTNDMRDIYASTKILVVPSVWEEAWGRVATEAHFSGIPVIGSNRGGIPEAIGPGGLILPIDADAGDWARAVASVATNPDVYIRLSRAASDYAGREELDLQTQMEQLERVCQKAMDIKGRHVVGTDRPA